MKKKYDLIFGIGEACSCTQALRGAGLQIKSFPFDWLYGSDFLGRIEILSSCFKDFFKKEDLVDTKTTNLDKKNLCKIYKNKRNKIVFNHDFLEKMPFDEAYPNVFEKYQRRIGRLFSLIKQAKSFLVVYIETPNAEEKLTDKKDLKKAFSFLQKAFPHKKIDLIYFSNTTKAFDKQSFEEISKHILLARFNYSSIKENDPDYAINGKLIKKILRQKFRLKMSFKERIYQILRKRGKKLLRRLEKIKKS
ncbi:MAG: DUF1796 family putative cysteine peptidase [Alphaproteobacteria bacterium]|nr:DUF1796 family putative cysteine peptidase [Alphaproteobacteria bacterium]